MKTIEIQTNVQRLRVFVKYLTNGIKINDRLDILKTGFKLSSRQQLTRVDS